MGDMEGGGVYLKWPGMILEKKKLNMEMVVRFQKSGL